MLIFDQFLSLSFYSCVGSSLWSFCLFSKGFFIAMDWLFLRILVDLFHKKLLKNVQILLDRNVIYFFIIRRWSWWQWLIVPVFMISLSVTKNICNSTQEPSNQHCKKVHVSPWKLLLKTELFWICFLIRIVVCVMVSVRIGRRD